MGAQQNGLLKTLPRAKWLEIESLFEEVQLAQGEVLFEADEPFSHAYFFKGGLSSEIVLSSDGKKTEVGCIGYEGFSAVPLALGVERTPHRAFMQVGGPAFRIRAVDLTEAMRAIPMLQRVLLLYAHVFMLQVAASALTDSQYLVDQRLARWILMCHDRLRDELPLTHDFLALMLGVRRASVTDATHRLEAIKAIKAERGLITVKDRAALINVAGGSYGVPEGEYARLIEPLFSED